MAYTRKGSLPIAGGNYLYPSHLGSNIFSAEPSEPLTLTPYDLDNMINFHTIAQALSIIKSAYASRDWRIKGDNETIVKWLDDELRALWPVFINDALTAIEYGKACFFKEYEIRDGEYHIKNLIPLKPHFVKVLVDSNGQFAGFYHEFYAGGETSVEQIPVDRAFLYVYDYKFNNYNGKSRLYPARFVYSTYKYVIEMANLFYQRYADPEKVGYAPSGKGKDSEGNEKYNIEIMSRLLKQGAPGGKKDIALPSESDEKGNRKWAVSYLESSRTGADYIQYLTYLEKKMAHALLIPELAFTQTETGSYNLGDVQVAQIAYKADNDMAVFGYFIEQYIINPLLDLNFGAQYKNKFKIEFTKASKQDKQLINQIIQAAAQNDGITFDFDQLSHITGLKLSKNEAAVVEQIGSKKNNLKLEKFNNKQLFLFGGDGSGNFGHSGRPGLVGGSSGESMYKLGQSHKNISDRELIMSGNFPESVASPMDGEDREKRAFYEAGKNGQSMPVYGTGYRYGKAPAGEYSYNARSQKLENGTSMMHAIDDKGNVLNSVDSLSASFIKESKGKPVPIYKYSGLIVNGKGGDGEPLMVNLKNEEKISKNQLIKEIGGENYLENINKRKLYFAEGRVNFEKLNNIYNSADAIYGRMLLKLEEMKVKAKAAGLGMVGGNNIDSIEALKLLGKAEYQKSFAEELLRVFTAGYDSVVEELELKKAVKPAELKMAEIKAKQAAMKQMDDLEYGIKNILLAGISTSATSEILSKQLDDYFTEFNKKLKVGIAMSVQETVDDGRRDAADDPDVELAQWSAILDESLCELCAWLDGKVVRVDDPLYAEYTPGNVHPNCRCVWVYILKSEVNKPDPDLMPIPPEYEGYLRR